MNSMIEPEDGGPESPVNKGITKRSRLAHLEKTYTRQEAYLYLFELSDSDDEFADNFSEVLPQKQKQSDTSSVQKLALQNQYNQIGPVARQRELKK